MTRTTVLPVGRANKSTEKDDKPAGLPCAWSSASFWHSQPNKFLLRHRTTPDLPEYADIVIVGSGITGASIARYLAEDERAKGLSVVMLEAREVCWGATGRNGGHCQPLLFDRTPEVAAFEMKNVETVKSYIEKHAIDCEWRSVTSCRTFWAQEPFDAAKAEIAALRKSHPDLGKLVETATDKDTLKRSLVRAECCGVTLTQGAGQLWPYKYVTAIVESLVKQGKLNVQTETPVTKISEGKISTPRGTISAKQVILATNGYTSHLAENFADLIVPVRCEMSALHPLNRNRLPNSYGMVGFGSGKLEQDDYLVQRPFDDDGKGGHLMFGGGRGAAMYNCVGETDDDVVDPGEAAYLRRNLTRMLDLGGHEELHASHQWTGIKGFSRDKMPWVGKISEGVWLSGGYTGHGMPNATLCGKAVVEMVLARDYEEVCEQLVKSGDLPRSYVLTKKRMEAARKLATVRVQDGTM